MQLSSIQVQSTINRFSKPVQENTQRAKDSQPGGVLQTAPYSTVATKRTVPPMRASDAKVPASETSNSNGSRGRRGSDRFLRRNQTRRAGRAQISANASSSSIASVEPFNSSFEGRPHLSSVLQRQGSLNSSEAEMRWGRKEVRHARYHEDRLDDRR